MKKALSILLSAVMTVSMFSMSPAVYADTENIDVTYNKDSYGTGWNYNSETCTLTLDGTADLGNVYLYCNYKADLEFTINLTGDTCNVGSINFYDTSYCVTCTITSKTNSTLNVTGEYGGINGSGVGGDVLTFDGVTVNTACLKIGASGGYDSCVKLQNGANVTIEYKNEADFANSTFSDIYVTGNSTLTVNGGTYALDTANHTNLNGTVDIEAGSKIILTASNYALGSEYSKGTIAYKTLEKLLEYCPSGTQILTKKTEYGSRPVMCDSDGNILTSLILSNPPQETSVANEGTDVTGTYSSEPQTVYCVDISWGSMEFTYDEGTKKWDETTHKYNYEGSGWTYDVGSNEVTVSNRSNAAVKASAVYESETGYESLGFSFDKSDFELNSADETYTAQSNTFTLTPPESFPSTISTDNLTELKKVGTVTITLDEADEVS